MKRYISPQLLLLIVAILVTARSAAQGTDSLAHYLEIAARQNPAVNADFLSYKATLEKLPQVGAYPDPQLEIGYFLKPMDIIDGQQIADFSLMQMFPWFGTRKAARAEAGHMANMAMEQFRETRNNVYLQVYSQWFLLCSLQQQLNNSLENKDILSQLETLALRKYAATPAGNSASGNRSQSAPISEATATATGGMNMASNGGTMGSSGSMGSMGNLGNSGSQSMAKTRTTGNSMGRTTSKDANSGNSMSSMASGTGMQSMNVSNGMSNVLRIQLEMAEIENKIESLQSQINAETAAFNTLLNRPSNSKVHLPDSITPIPFTLDIDQTTAQINQHNPMLAMINEEGSAYIAKSEMDKKMGYPMVGIGLQYSIIGKRMEMEHSGLPVTEMNGMDMIMPMLSITLPIFRNKHKALQKENNLRWQANRQQLANTQNLLQTELYRTKHAMDDASRMISLYEKQSQLARTTYQLMVQEFISGKSDLTDIIQVQRQLLEYRLKKAEAIAEYNTLVASIYKLISFQDI